MAYESGYKKGIDVAAGDIDDDGIDEIITTPGDGKSALVRIFNVSGNKVGEFVAYPSFTGGIKVAVGDIDGDGIDEIITSPAKGGGPHIKVFRADGSLVDEFFGASASSRNGTDVAAGDVTGNSNDEIIVGAGVGSLPTVSVFNAAGVKSSEFYAYSTTFKGGVRVSVGNVNSDSPKSEILTIQSSNAKGDVRLFSADGNQLDSNFFIEPWWFTRFDVAASSGKAWAATGGNRRTSVRPAF